MVCRIVSIVLLVLFISCPLYAGMWEEYQQNEYEIWYPPDLREMIKDVFPFLQILDEVTDLTSGIRFYQVKDTKTSEEYEIYRQHFISGTPVPKWWMEDLIDRIFHREVVKYKYELKFNEWQFKQKIANKWWFWDKTDKRKWRYKNWKTGEKEYLDTNFERIEKEVKNRIEKLHDKIDNN